MNEAQMPVLIGCGQMTDKQGPETGMTPIQLMAEVAVDAGPGQPLLAAVDTTSAAA